MTSMSVLLHACVLVICCGTHCACDISHSSPVLQEELFQQQQDKMLTQLKASHTQQKVAAEQVAELQEALKTAADTVKDCHKTNIALVSEKKV